MMVAEKVAGRMPRRAHPTALAQAAERYSAGECLGPRTNVRLLSGLFRNGFSGSQPGQPLSPFFLEPLMR
jgi:hypothetical protein